MTTNAAPPRKGRDSVKLTALSTEIAETPRTKELAQLLAAPPVHESQQKETVKDYLKHKETKPKTRKQSIQKDGNKKKTQEDKLS